MDPLRSAFANSKHIQRTTINPSSQSPIARTSFNRSTNFNQSLASQSEFSRSDYCQFKTPSPKKKRWNFEKSGLSTEDQVHSNDNIRKLCFIYFIKSHLVYLEIII